MEAEVQESIRKAAECLTRAGAREVYLFGSVASGVIHEHSDIDMAVSGLPPRIFFQAMSEAARFLDREMDLIDLDEDTPFVRFLREKGRLKRVA